MPSLFGHSVSKVFSQRYHGDSTILPRFNVAESLGLAIIMNPTRRDMVRAEAAAAPSRRALRARSPLAVSSRAPSSCSPASVARLVARSARESRVSRGARRARR